MRTLAQRMSVNHGNPTLAASPSTVAMAHAEHGPGPGAHGPAMREAHEPPIGGHPQATGGHPPAMAHAGPPHGEHHEGGHEH